ncbi:MAG: hypothetical protein R3D71_06115 [Rickettsiales bacterium]
MINIITIKSPNPFFSYLDEKSFFTWLESIDGVVKVAGYLDELDISLDVPLSEESLRDLIAVMHRYNVDKKCLKEFVTPENKKWFKDNKNAYWHNSIFGD